MSLRSFTFDDRVRRNAVLYGERAAFVHGQVAVTHAQYATAEPEDLAKPVSQERA